MRQWTGAILAVHGQGSLITLWPVGEASQVPLALFSFNWRVCSHGLHLIDSARIHEPGDISATSPRFLGRDGGIIAAALHMSCDSMKPRPPLRPIGLPPIEPHRPAHEVGFWGSKVILVLGCY
ncbi:hypothetical protein F5Y05DRAFT_266449 [Hypoxylon sp. FL0543]|nr:hypothetical protein F5Y05DRAFT_266449 [Hypoxylon sp. FL0543]